MWQSQVEYEHYSARTKIEFMQLRVMYYSALKMQMIARATAQSRDEVVIVKPHLFGRFLTSNYCKLSKN